MRGTVGLVEPLGADTLVTVVCAGHKLVARVPGDRMPQSGSEAGLVFDPESVILFDPQTGRR